MRLLSDTLTAAQKSMGNTLYKAVFTKTGETTQTYGCDTTNRILRMVHPEQEWSQKVDILVDNRDGNLTALDLTGYTCTASYGYNTSAGDEYSACAPLEVVSQQGVTSLGEDPSDLRTYFSAIGIFDMMAKDEAASDYSPSSSVTTTCKGFLKAIAEATLGCFAHCKAYTITFDSEDSLIDTFTPADSFKVSFKESRLSAFKKVLGWTRCKARIEDDGEIHVFDPTISGTTYNYEYNDAVTYHNFFEKSVRNRLVLPNRVYVSSHPDYTGQYTGNASDSTSYTALGRYENEYHRLRVISNAQCTAIATAILQHYQVGQEVGHGYAPLNCGQEVMDYVKITDSVAGDTRTGNIGYLKRDVSPGKFEFEFRFGNPELSGVSGLIPLSTPDTTNIYSEVVTLLGAYNALGEDMDSLIKLVNEIARRLVELENRESVPKWHVTERLIVPVVV